MADGTRIDLIEKNGLFYLRLEQIFEPDEIRAMIAMTPPHQPSNFTRKGQDGSRS